MKVKDAKDIKPLREVASKEKAAAAPGLPQAQDKVSVDSSAGFTRAVEEAKRSAGMSRMAKLEAIEAAVRSGTYRPDPQRIAEEILQAAAINASLRAIFKR